MKLQNELVLLTSLLSTFSLTSCGSDNDSDACDLNETICQSENKSFDADKCLCVEHAATCHLTQDNCQNEGKSFNADKCECVGNSDSSLCSAGKHVFGNTCEDDSIQNCGSHDHTCSTSVNGWKSGSCTEGACVATECLDGYHLYQNTCEHDEISTCGSHDNDCAVTQTGWKTGVCQNGTCQAQTCIENMHPEEGICVADNIEHCGPTQINCPQTVAGWSTGNCMNGKCQVATCADNYHFSTDTCVADTNTCCGIDCTNCENTNKLCSLGQCKLNCGTELTACDDACVDTLSDSANCSVCGNNCPSSTQCQSGSCETYTLSSSSTIICNGKTVYPYNDSSHCGRCGNECEKGKYCAAGVCTTEPATSETTTYCDGKAVRADIDSSNCSGCGNDCGKGKYCAAGVCTTESATNATATYCDGKLVYPYFDSAHCGGCGNECSSDKCISNLCRTITKGVLIPFGHYEQDDDPNTTNEPITWRVLDTNASGQYLIISEKALDVQPYNTSWTDITWEQSTIRSWLNGYDESYNEDAKDYTSKNFINAAFTDTEQMKIVSSNIPAHANPDYDAQPGNATTDKIFLLSITEAQQYFTDDADRQADATRYVVKNGAYVYGSVSENYTSDSSCTDVHCYADWWLRSPGMTNAFASTVYSNIGLNDNAGSIVDNTNVAVRPALWLNL